MRTEPNEDRDSPRSATAVERSDTEATLERIWSELLDLHPIGRDDDFLELGGESMTAQRIMARILEEWQVELPLAEFFEHQTIREMASYIDTRRGRGEER